MQALEHDQIVCLLGAKLRLELIATFQYRDIKVLWNLRGEFPLFTPRYNIAPSQEVPVILRNEDRNELKLMRWGLVPSWAQDRSIGQRMINARAERLLEKPSFKQLVTTRRCLVPADGFFEWWREGSRKVSMWSHEIRFSNHTACFPSGAFSLRNLARLSTRPGYLRPLSQPPASDPKELAQLTPKDKE
jgi:hypothetical protein